MQTDRRLDKKERLERIYALFDQTMAPYELCCDIRCAACCTCNVAVTGLEARLLLDTAGPLMHADIMDRLTAVKDQRRYQPVLTTNMYARYCIEDRQIPPEENDPAWGRCPLLENEMCPVYSGRPFGCRALVSQVNCSSTGTAQVPEIVLTYQNIFMQAIEHLDAGGIYGNLIDVLTGMLNGTDDRGSIGGQRFARNEPIKVLMVPPAHRQVAAEVIGRLNELIQTC